MNTCLDSCHLAKPLLVANSPHPTHDAARPFGNRQGPTHSCWSRRRVFGRTPQLQGVPRKTINPQNAVSSTATVAHKTVRVLQWARIRSSVPSEPTPGMCNAHLPFRTPDQNVRFDPPHSLKGGTSGTSASVCALQLKTKRNQVLHGSTVFMRDEAVLMVSTVQPDSLSTRTIFILA